MSLRKFILFDAEKASAALFGMAIPSLVFGRVVFAVTIILSCVFLVYVRSWRPIYCDIKAHSKKTLGLLILFTFFMWLPNLFNSSFPLRSFEAVFRSLCLIIIACGFHGFLAKDHLLLKISFNSFVIMSGISVGFALISIYVLPELFWSFRLQGWLNEPVGIKLKGFSALSVLIMPLLILTALQLKNLSPIYSIALIILFLIVVFSTYNRSAIAGVLAIILVIGFLYSFGRGRALYRMIGLILVLCVFSLIIYWLWTSRGSLGELQKIAASSEGKWLFPLWLIDHERQTIWSAAIKFGLEAPFFGIGVNTINFVPGAELFIENTNYLPLIPAHPHNWAIEIFSETGVVGLFFLFLVIVFMFGQAFFKWKNDGEWACLMAIALMAGYWVSGLFNFSYWSAWWQLSYFIALTLCYASIDRSKNIKT